MQCIATIGQLAACTIGLLLASNEEDQKEGNVYNSVPDYQSYGRTHPQKLNTKRRSTATHAPWHSASAQQPYE